MQNHLTKAGKHIQNKSIQYQYSLTDDQVIIIKYEYFYYVIYN